MSKEKNKRTLQGYLSESYRTITLTKPALLCIDNVDVTWRKETTSLSLKSAFRNLLVIIVWWFYNIAFGPVGIWLSGSCSK